jgi:phenylalanyl-tRNA synthetase beta chain
MRIVYKWLKEYVDIKESPEGLSKMLMEAGLPTESIEDAAGDGALELEVTANRPDWLSYLGVAREVSAITRRKLKIPSVKVPAAKGGGLEVKIEDKKLCPRYTARIIRGVKVTESPAWLKARIESMGLRPVNNIVDITNFCLFETGEPMHAFDLDKLSGSGIIVRKAKAQEKIRTIDSVERSLDGSTLVIADGKGAVAIAGVMGGLDTEVNYSTKNILLEAASFDPISIRRTSRRLALSTDSSYRFERRVDIAAIKYASDRTTQLILKTAGGQAGQFIDAGIKGEKLATAFVRIPRLDSLLGHAIPRQKVKRILADLGLRQKTSTKDKSVFYVPSFRRDLKKEVDLIEEVARVYGYNKIQGTIPAITAQPERMPLAVSGKNKVRTVLSGLGMDEIITYSLLSKKALKNAAFVPEDAVRIANPLSAEQEVMRPSLIPGMLGTVLWNINRRSKDLKLFEIGSIYLKESSGFVERTYLGACVTGEISSWAGGSRPYSFFDLKGAVEALLTELGIDGVSFADASDCRFSGKTCASVEINGEDIGLIGEIDGQVLKDFDIKAPVYACEICLDKIFGSIIPVKKFEQLAKYPSVTRDISIITSRQTKSRDIEAVIKNSAGTILKNITLVDKYSGKQIPDGKISLTYRLEYQDPSRTLEERDVTEAQKKVLASLESQLGVKLR